MLEARLVHKLETRDGPQMVGICGGNLTVTVATALVYILQVEFAAAALP